MEMTYAMRLYTEYTEYVISEKYANKVNSIQTDQTRWQTLVICDFSAILEDALQLNFESLHIW